MSGVEHRVFLVLFSEEDLTGEEEEIPSFRGEGHIMYTHASLTTTNTVVCVCVCVFIHQ